MSSAIKHLLNLTDLLAAHQGVSHWAISMRVAAKGDFLERLRNGGDCATKTHERVMARLSAEWPADLAWPASVPRPPKAARREKAA